jgi:aryl-alcohol dehydrogenase-like predicted oxidoreductase
MRSSRPQARPADSASTAPVEDLLKVAADVGIPPHHAAIALTVTHTAITSAVIGPRTMDQRQDLPSAADLRLDEVTLNAIDAIVPAGTLVDENDRGFDPWPLEP